MTVVAGNPAVGARHHAIKPRRRSIVFELLLSAFLVVLVDGHGHMTSPRSRNWLATAGQDGVNSATPEKPDAEYCTHCLNVNDPTEGSCGISPYHNYNTWLDSTGSPMPFDAEGFYQEGEVITVESWMDTHHNGHVELRLCNLGQDGTNAFTPDCFDGNILEFVEDVVVLDQFGNEKNWPKMLADEHHPERGYLSGGQSEGSKHTFVMRFRLPYGIVGERILLQWKYITANSCSPPGYADYFSSNGLPGSYWTSGLGLCTRPCYEDETCSSPFNDDGERSATMPEQFFNCAEIEIRPAAPTVSPRPTKSPTTSSPTKSQKPTPSTPQGTGCCTIDFKNCSPTVEGWCSESESNCVGPCDKFWLSNGAVDGCNARYESCSSDYDCCSPGLCIDGKCGLDGDSSGGPTNPTPSSTPAPNSSENFGEGCCSWGSGTCEQPNNDWCHAMQSQCEGSCSGVWIVLAPTTASPTASPETATPTFSKSPTKAPTTKSPSYVFEGNKCSTNVLPTIDALNEMDAITYTVSTNPYTLSVQAEGGAAGSGDVVSEGQAYGMLAAALALADTDANDPLYFDALNKFYGYYNGWKRMCENSLPNSSCQATKYCNGFPCLPGWKHSGDLSSLVGSGAAPDGDVDAIVGMIIFVKVMEANGIPPEWSEQVSDVKDWADKSCTQFLVDNTVLSDSGNHRLLKLGSCWGGWETNGNNPSYHAPGHYKMMRDFQASISSRGYPRPDSLGGDNRSWDEKWNMLIDTSYKFLNTAQCPSSQPGSGLVPNWALVTEVDANTLDGTAGSFSGSGTPQYEFGAEASRTMWRVAFDALAYPEEAEDEALPFLEPLYGKLSSGFNPNHSSGLSFAFAESSLEACPPTVSNVFSGWIWNGFMYGPVLSTIVAYDNQDMIDAACAKVGYIPGGESYYSRSWLVISSMTLNGAIAKAGSLFHGGGSPTPPSNPPPSMPPPTTVPTNPAPSNPPPSMPPPTTVPTNPPPSNPPPSMPPPTTVPTNPAPSNPPPSMPPPTTVPTNPPPSNPPPSMPPPTTVPTNPPPSNPPPSMPPPTTVPTNPAPSNPPPSMPPPTTVPTNPPPSPTNPAPSPVSQTPDYYCDWGNGYEQPENDYCHGSKENCEGNCNGFFVDPNNSYAPPNNNCIAEWQACTNNHNGCCGGLTCYVQSQWYAQCKK